MPGYDVDVEDMKKMTGFMSQQGPSQYKDVVLPV